MKKLLIVSAALALLSIAAPAAAKDNGGCQGNCPSTGGPSTSEANAGAIGVGVGVGVGIGGAGGQGGEGGRGGAGGTAIAGGGNATALGVQGQGQKQTASSDQAQSQSQHASQLSSQANTQATSTTVGGQQSAQSIGMNYEAAAASAFGQGAVGRKVCGVVIGGGVQSLGHGYSVGIPLPAPQCNARENLTAGMMGASQTSNPSFWADVLMEAYVTGQKPAKVYALRAKR